MTQGLSQFQLGALGGEEPAVGGHMFQAEGITSEKTLVWAA